MAIAAIADYCFVRRIAIDVIGFVVEFWEAIGVGTKNCRAHGVGGEVIRSEEGEWEMGVRGRGLWNREVEVDGGFLEMVVRSFYSCSLQGILI